MRSFSSIVVLTSMASAAFASVLPIIGRDLPSGEVTCGSNEYSPSDLSAAISAGLEDLNDSDLQGVLLLYC